MTETVETTDAPGPFTLAFIGAGRAGSALAAALHESGHRILAVHSRTAAHARRLATAAGATVTASAVETVVAADITLATVPDSQIGAVAAAVARGGPAIPPGRALVHCSATFGPEALAAATQVVSTGAFHPLQALAGAASAPLLVGAAYVVEAPEPLRSHLMALARDLEGEVLDVAPEARALYHAAAVLAGNAPLTLLARATALLEEAGIEHDAAHRALARLLGGAAANAASNGAAGALTGPVVRGDAATVRRHLDVLAADPSTRELYRRLALETLALAGPEGREDVADTLAAAAPPRRRARGARVVAHPRVA